MASQGPFNAATVIDDATIGAQAWINTALAQGPINGTWSAAAGSAGPTQTHYLNFQGMGFAIPGGSTIDGIIAAVQVRQGATGTVHTHFQLIQGGVVQATNRSPGGALPPLFAPALVTVGGASDLWGGGWTVANINAGNFGFVYAAQINNNSSAQIDAVELTVHYTMGSGMRTSQMSQMVIA